MNAHLPPSRIPFHRVLRAAPHQALRALIKIARRLKERGRPAHRSCFDVGGTPTHLEFSTLSRLSPLARAAAPALLLMALPFTASGQTWTGTTSGSWTTATNWSGGVAPVSGNTTDVIIDGTTNVGSMFLGTAITLRSLTFSATNDANTRISMTGNTNPTANARNLTFSSNSGNATLTVEAGSTGNQTIDRGGTGAASSIILTSSLDVIHNGSGTLTLGNGDTGAGTSRVTGAGNINKSGTGPMILAGANDYSGATTINAGNLTLSGGSAISDTGTITLADTAGAILHIAASETIGSLQGGGTTGGNVSIAASQILTIAETGTNTFGGVILGSGGLTKNGTGTLTLTNASSNYSGATTINAGTLQIGHDNALGTGGNISFSGGGLKYDTGITTDLSSRIKNSSSAILIDTNSNNVTFATAIASGNTGGLTKNGTGTLTLTNASNDYSGATTINAGTLSISVVGALGSTSGVNLGNAAELRYTGSAATLSRDITVTSGTATVANTGSGLLTLSGGLTKNGTTLVLDGGSNGINVTGAITGSAANSDLVVNGNVTLSTANSYNGPTTINGNLTAAVTNAMQDTTNVVINSGGSLIVTADNAINDSATINMTGGILKFTGNVTETVGMLTLSANSIIDLGTGSVAASFADLAMGIYNLSIYNWSGTTLRDGGDGNNIDKIYFNQPLSGSELGRISFYSDFGNNFLGTGFQLSGGSFANEVIPVPEAETYATGLLLLLGGGVWMWRKRKADSTKLAI